MKTKIALYVVRVVGGLLLVAALMLGLSNASSHFAQPNDLLLGTSTRITVWIAGMLVLVVAMICVFGERIWHCATWLVWLAIQFWVYRTALWFSGYQHATIPMGNIPETFKLSAGMVDCLANVLFSFVLFSGVGLLLWRRLEKTGKKEAETAEPVFKVHCVHCGGHVAFSKNWVGMSINCPHCSGKITLQSA